MGIRVDQNILNQKGTPAFNAAPFSARPTAGFLGRIFISTDTYEIFRDESVGWSLIADAGAGSGTLESVTFNGNNTPYGINITNGGLFLLGSTNGSIFFAAGGSGQFTTDSTNFFWDDTNNRLGIGTAAPSARLDVHSSSGTSAILNGTGVSNALLTFQSAGVNKWSVGNFVSSTVANDFNIYDAVNTVSRLQVHNTGVVNIPTSLIIGTTTPTSIYAFDVTGTSRFTAQITGLSATFSSTLNAGTTTINGNGTVGSLIIKALAANEDIAIEYKTSANVRRGYIGYGALSSTLFEICNNENGDISFRANGSERMRIFSTGKLQAINTLSGDVVMDFRNDSATGYGGAIKGGSGTLYSFKVEDYVSNVVFQVRGDGLINTGTSASSPYNNTTGNAANVVLLSNGVLYRSTSSLKYKTDVKNYDKGLAEVLQMRPVYYKSVGENDGDKQFAGLIAEEIHELGLIEFVQYAKDGTPDALAYSNMIALLTKAIQELNEKLIRNNIN